MRTFEKADFIGYLNSNESQFENLKNLGTSLGLIFEIENNKITDITNYSLHHISNIIYQSFVKYSDGIYINKTFFNKAIIGVDRKSIDINLSIKTNLSLKYFDVFYLLTSKNFYELKRKLNTSSNKAIDSLCPFYNIHNYTINEDGTIDVDDDIHLSNYNLEKLPLKFGRVTGSFYCYNNKLVSLEGCPNYVGGNFYCYNNKLVSLDGCPNEVGGNFRCSENRVMSLLDSPKQVGGDFYCQKNQLISLNGITENLTGVFNCGFNKITSLRGLSENIKNIYCEQTPIGKYWDKLNDINKLEVFLYMDIDTTYPKEMIQQKIDYIIQNS